MEDESQFEPPLEEVNQSIADFDNNEIMSNPNLNMDDLGDFEELINLFDQAMPKNNNNKNEPTSSNLITMCKNNEKSINSDEELIKKLKTFLKRAYNLICAHDKDNELIEKEKIEEDSDNEDNNDKDDEIKFMILFKNYLKKKKLKWKYLLKAINLNLMKIILLSIYMKNTN